MGMFSALHPTRQLDLVLSILYRENPPIHTALEIADEVEKMHGLAAGESEIIAVLEKLIIDGLAIREIREVIVSKGSVNFLGEISTTNADKIEKVAYYLITFEGKVRLVFEGGYQGELKKKDQEKIDIAEQRTQQKRLQTNLNILTAVIAIGTLVAALYYLNELCRYYHWFSFCECP